MSARSSTPDLYSPASAREPSPSSQNSPSSLPTNPSSRHILPADLPNAIKQLDNQELDRVLSAVLTEQKRRGRKHLVSSERSRKRQVEAPPSLTQGQRNAVRAAFKAGVTPSRIARQFEISQSNVRKALAGDGKNVENHLSGITKKLRRTNTRLRMAMAKDQDPFELWTATEQITKQAQGAMENYFGWLQTTMSAFPWSNTNLNRILLSNATQNVTATFAFVQKLTHAKNFQDVVQIQTVFMETQMNSFNEQAKILGEIYSKAAQDSMKTPVGGSR